MKKIFSSFIKRPLRNWNVENRAQKVLDQHLDDPTPAPRHPRTKQLLNEFTSEHPELLEAMKNKDAHLDGMLKEMVVNPDKLAEFRPKLRPLPQDKSPVKDPEYGYLEPDVASPGRCSIRQALEFITQHHMKPNEYSAQDVAKEYNLDLGQVQQILKYYHMLWMQIPKTAQERKALEDHGIDDTTVVSNTMLHKLTAGQSKPDSSQPDPYSQSKPG